MVRHTSEKERAIWRPEGPGPGARLGGERAPTRNTHAPGCKVSALYLSEHVCNTGFHLV